MKLSEYRNTLSWQGAIALGPTLLRLAEELPAAEELGLGFALRQGAVELPATIAADLVEGREPGILGVLKLSTALELIDKVYPALDTADIRKAVEDLLTRLKSGSVADNTARKAAETHAETVHPAPEHPAPAHPAAEPHKVVPVAADTPIVPSEVPHHEEHPEPKSIPVEVEAPSEEVHVHTDSEE
jgi:hypothetical protein